MYAASEGLRTILVERTVHGSGLANGITLGVSDTAGNFSGSLPVQVSADYVFSGRARAPYDEAEPHDPISAYGRTKAAGERLALENNPGRTYVVRTAWLYGAHGPNFAKTMLKLAADRDTPSVVNDQHRQPTTTGTAAMRP